MGRGQAQPVEPLSIGLITAIRIRLARNGWTQRDLANATGLSENYVSVRMLGERVFTVYDLDVIARAFATTPQQLLTEATREAPHN